jgi:hypothetical protein
MRRSRSGQVLVAAATLMLAVLLVSAMSIPVINTDIEPSSEIYRIVREALYQNAELIITSMSAYQCASAMVYKDSEIQARREFYGKLLERLHGSEDDELQ